MIKVKRRYPSEEKELFNFFIKKKNEEYIFLSERSLWIEYEGELLDYVNFETINELVVHYGTTSVDQEAANPYTEIAFTLGNKTYQYFFKASESIVLEICELLYDNKVKFKEYSFDKRVFLGKKPNYNEIQKIKQKYNIEW